MTTELIGGAPPLHPGKTAHFVRYFQTADGWRSEVIVGVYLNRDRNVFRIRVGNEDKLRELERGTWEVCVP